MEPGHITQSTRSTPMTEVRKVPILFSPYVRVCHAEVEQSHSSFQTRNVSKGV
jgi:hypothetical protein